MITQCKRYWYIPVLVVALAVCVTAGAIWQAKPAAANLYSPARIAIAITAGQETNLSLPAFQQSDLPRCKPSNKGFAGLAPMYASVPGAYWNGLVVHNRAGVGGAALLHGYPLKPANQLIIATIDCGKEVDAQGNVGEHIHYNVGYDLTITGTAPAPGAYGHAHPQADIYGSDPLFGEVETLSDEFDKLSDTVNVLSTRVAQMQTTIGNHIGDEEDTD